MDVQFIMMPEVLEQTESELKRYHLMIHDAPEEVNATEEEFASKFDKA